MSRFKQLREAYEAGWTTQHIVWKSVATTLSTEVMESDDLDAMQDLLLELADLADDMERIGMSVSDVRSVDDLILQVGDKIISFFPGEPE